jgi:antitoxin VapB
MLQALAYLEVQHMTGQRMAGQHVAGRYVRLFRNGRNQAVRIPREFELPGDGAILRKEGQRLIIEPVPPKSLLAVLESLPTLDEDFGAVEDRPATPAEI